jgi:hypothetical protein
MAVRERHEAWLLFAQLIDMIDYGLQESILGDKRNYELRLS